MTQMQIVIEVEGTSPPSGRVRVSDHVGVENERANGPFSGWIGLLRALSEALGMPSPPSESPARPD